jgi:CheY-like chemotaxis protein
VSRRKILLVDDSEIVREVVREILEGGGYEVATHGSAFGFSSVLMRQRPDLVLLDVGMPALTGDKVAAIALRNHIHDCPLVLFSDRSPTELARLTKECGADGFINKTEDPAALLRAVSRFLHF